MSYIKNFSNRTSFAYQFSVDNKQDDDLIVLQQRVQERNALVRKRCREWNELDSYYKLHKITLMARGPRLHEGRRYSTSLPHKYAVYFDVYLSEDKEATENLRREIEEGYTPSMWRKKCEFENKARLIEFYAEQRLREAAA